MVVKNAAQEALGHFPTLVPISYPFSNHEDPHPIMPLKARLREKGPTCKFLLQFPIRSGFYCPEENRERVSFVPSLHLHFEWGLTSLFVSLVCCSG